MGLEALSPDFVFVFCLFKNIKQEIWTLKSITLISFRLHYYIVSLFELCIHVSAPLLSALFYGNYISMRLVCKK